MNRTVSEISQVFARSMVNLDPAPLADFFAADAVYELPFQGHRVEGREAILATLTAAGARGRTLGLEKVQVSSRETADGLAVELTVEGRNPHTGDSYGFPSSVGLLTVRDGEITAYRDFPNTAAVHTMTAAKTVFQRFLDASVENRWDDLADLYAEDVVLEMPFTPAGVPRVTHGRDELRKRFRAAGQVRRMTKADNVVLHETTDPEVLVAEFDLHGEFGGEPFVSSYVMVLTVRGGEIVHTRDYADTAAAAKRITALRTAPPEV
ncbi:nuclear transport factor 2 family protein [Amycolatopsis sp. NPDC051903]|uniref:nuclear transport factor 2 family protein n=1 Tax=Amycolatopsis sp. NPDC051903 TaxID=3363936 RepID=UPI003790A89B